MDASIADPFLRTGSSESPPTRAQAIWCSFAGAGSSVVPVRALFESLEEG